MSPDILEKTVGKLRGIPCWRAQQGWGSFLTFEFGARLVDPPITMKDGRERPSIDHGEWHLWIYCCVWRILNGTANLLAHSNSEPEQIASACRAFQGSAFTKYLIEPQSGGSQLCFEGAAKLVTQPYGDPLQEQWMLFCPDGYVLTYRGDGAFAYDRGDSIEKSHFVQAATSTAL
jgi:hypothetical protein